MATRRSAIRAMAALAGSMTLLAGLWTTPAHSAYAVPHLDNIRVGLFMNAGEFNNAVPAVTLSADGGLVIGIRSGSTPHTWLDGTYGKVRVSLDQFRIQLADASDANLAKDASSRIEAAGSNVNIFQTMRTGKTVYQTAVGPFPTKEAAAAALNALKGNPTVGSLMQTATITGPVRGAAGTYAVQADAENQVIQLQQKGLPAELAVQDGADGNPAFTVVIGGESDLAAWNQVKQRALATAPGLQIRDMAASESYLLRRMELPADGGGTEPIVHLQMNATGQKTWITPKQGRIAVAEKNGHTYRGGVELLASNGELAVVNELPFEQYLYSVVNSEMGSGWPQEALKAQAVSARTYALKNGMKYPVAQVSDTTRDQAYTGVESEDTIRAVDATKGEVLTDASGALIATYYSSNAGGMTASPSEVWGGTDIPYLGTAPSPDDRAEQGKLQWKHIEMPDGKTGYVREDLIKDTGSKNAAGLPIYVFTDSAANVRAVPYVDNAGNPPIAQMNTGDHVVVFGQAIESNAYEWLRGPYSSDWVAERLSGYLPGLGTVNRLEVTARGPSSRVMQIKANGQSVNVKYPDLYRTVFGSLPSTRFEIVETGRYTIQGAGGIQRSAPENAGTTYVLRAGDTAPKPVESPSFFVMDGSGNVREATRTPEFIFKGQGFGHGLGMSQWGARGYAELGYDYQSILKFYYRGVSIVKE